MAQPDNEERRARLRRNYGEVRSATESLAAPLSPEDQTVQSMPDVSPTKWHRGHTSWFFETFVLSTEDPGYRAFHPAFGYLFNSYYETVGTRHPRPERGLLSRPGAREVSAFRAHVDRAMSAFLDREPAGEVLDLVELGLHHEQQHQELLLMDIKHVLSCNPLRPAYAGDAVGAKEAPVGEQVKMGWVEHGGGLVQVGHSGTGFAFDNESPRHAVYLTPFALADRLVTCGEWLEFVEDGGYRSPELWLSEGWATVQALGWSAPLYWAPAEGPGRTVFTLSGERTIELAEPAVHLSYYEADAFARWSGARLPTEAEWEAVAADGSDPPRTPPRLHPRRAAADGELQLFGDAWQWTSSAYGPYPGFRPSAGAVGEYNGKFMVNQQVLRGSACVTPGGHSRPTYRNFFPAGARWAYSGVRLARDL